MPKQSTKNWFQENRHAGALEGTRQATSNLLASTLGNSFVAGKDLVAGRNQDILAGQDALRQAAQTQQGLAGQQQGLLGQVAQGYSGADAIANQAYADIRNRGMENLGMALSANRGTAAGMGQSGSSRQGVMDAIATRGALADIGSQQNAYDQWRMEKAQQQKLQALGQMPAAMQGAAIGGNTLNQVGMQDRAIQQELLNEPLIRQQAELARLQGLTSGQAQMMQFGGSSYGRNTSSVSMPEQKQGGSKFGKLLGAGLTLGGMMMGGPAGAGAGSALGSSLAGGGQGGGSNFGSDGFNNSFFTPASILGR